MLVGWTRNNGCREPRRLSEGISKRLVGSKVIATSGVFQSQRRLMQYARGRGGKAADVGGRARECDPAVNVFQSGDVVGL